MDINYNHIGKRVASRRKQLNLTQAQLSEKAKLTPKYISNIETSHSIPSIESIMLLCASLDVEPNYLLSGVASKNDLSKIEEINRLFSACNAEQLEKILEYTEFITKKP